MERKHNAVGSRVRGLIADTWQTEANLSFFLILEVLLAFILPAVGFGKHDFQLYSDCGFSVMLISGVAIAWGRKKLFVLAVLVGSGALATRWLTWGHTNARLLRWSDWWTIATMLVISIVLLTQIFRSGRVTHVRIQGAIAVYLLFGLGWAHAYHIVAILNPTSFTFPAGEAPAMGDWIYFSFVTLTTVGYGDITPLRPIARTLAMGEALAGQLYLAVMIARLVAMEVVFWQQKTMGSDS
jgi:voltage-gated potassium channel Kch